MGTPNFKNRTFFHGDNLDFLREMNSETVKLIATDPPFKKQQGWFSNVGGYKDTWTWQRDAQGLDLDGNAVAENHAEWMENARKDLPKVVAAVENARTTYGDDMGAFICWMAPRLLEMHRALMPDGSLYLHCDPTASHYLKALLDAIFGKQNFRNEIVWHYSKWTNSADIFQRNHDIILCYSKGENYTFNKQYGELTKRQRQLRETGYNAGSQSGRKILRVYDREKAKLQIQQAESEGRAVYYIDEPLVGSPLSDVWEMSVLNGQAKERTGYPTQKPLALYERIIKASSNAGDLVLDPFCGCATTCVAAERLGRQWVGIDIAEVAHGLILQRLQDSRQLLADGVPEVHYETAAPERTDAGDIAAPNLALRSPAKRADWQKLTRAQMTQAMRQAQRSGEQGLVICAGCGRELEPEFMHLDHRTPKSERGEDDITNRILLCQPCNGKKSNTMTLTGLWRTNRRDGWMQAETKAKVVMDRAIDTGQRVRDEWGGKWVKDLLAAL